MATIQVADKPTLDGVDLKCDEILEAVSSGVDLTKVKVYIGDFRSDEMVVTNGGIDSTRGVIST